MTSEAGQTEVPSTERVEGRGGSDRHAYTAVLYVHGMGSQRRLEELSRLVDSLDRYAHHRSGRTGRLSNIALHLEPSRTAAEGEVAYIQVDRRSTSEQDGVRPSVHRFYEAYWASVTADGVPTREVALWLLKQIGVPMTALRTCWRLRARLRRAALQEAWPSLVKRVPDATKGDLKALYADYDRFEGWEGRRSWPKGKADDFRCFIESRTGRPKERRARLSQLARRWQRRYLLTEVRNLFVLGSIGLAMVLVLLGSVALSLLALRWAAALPFADGTLAVMLPEDSPATAFAFVGVLLTLLGGTRFLSEFLGDVQFWTTYEETSAKHRQRREILDRCGESLRHVLEDPLCERVTLVAHSLGTTVALDTLLALARVNRARSPRDERRGPVALHKIQHLITLGSPIDKVHYFFESHAGQYHRYNCVVEELRGDVGTYPFALNGRPLLHWINFWDRADVISGALHTPTNRAYPFLAVDNVETTNVRLPDPSTAHSAYFENAGVIGTIFDVVFDDAHNYASAPPKEGGEDAPDYAAVRLGPGGGSPRATFFQASLLAVPWLSLVALVSRQAGVELVSVVAGGAALAILFSAAWLTMSSILRPRPCDPLDAGASARMNAGAAAEPPA